MNVLVYGNGGREYAVAQRMALEDARVFQYPPSKAKPDFITPVTLRPQKDEVDELIRFAHRAQIDFVFVGPEEPLNKGLADRFRAEEIPVFGCNQEAAWIESSKARAKDVMKLAQIATAPYQVFSDVKALTYCRLKNWKVAIKADGLCGGKGVTLSQSEEDCREALERLIAKRTFGKAGEVVVIEDLLTGEDCEEVSVFALVYGPRNEFVMVPITVQDTKDLNGKNTGGMGCVAPVPWMEDPDLQQQAEEVVGKLMSYLADRGIRYQGALYVGFMRVGRRLYVLEFNIRLGDPEAQALMALWEGSFTNTAYAVACGIKPEWKDLHLPRPNRFVVGHVAAVAGYPEKPRVGDPITGIGRAKEVEGVTVIHAGTELREDPALGGAKLYYTAAGRVLMTLAEGGSIAEAYRRSYGAMKLIAFPGMQVSPRVAERFPRS